MKAALRRLVRPGVVDPFDVLTQSDPGRREPDRTKLALEVSDAAGGGV